MRVLDRYKDPTHRDRDWWESIPQGLVSHIDQHDLPREVHIARARELVSLGASFAVLLDLEARDIIVVRLEGLEIVAAERDWTLPELPFLSSETP